MGFHSCHSDAAVVKSISLVDLDYLKSSWRTLDAHNQSHVKIFIANFCTSVQHAFEIIPSQFDLSHEAPLDSTIK